MDLVIASPAEEVRARKQIPIRALRTRSVKEGRGEFPLDIRADEPVMEACPFRASLLPGAAHRMKQLAKPLSGNSALPLDIVFLRWEKYGNRIGVSTFACAAGVWLTAFVERWTV